MRCNNCRHAMNKTDEVTELNTRQTWYRCPVCESEHVTSEKVASERQRFGHTQRFSALSDSTAKMHTA